MLVNPKSFELINWKYTIQRQHAHFFVPQRTRRKFNSYFYLYLPFNKQLKYHKGLHKGLTIIAFSLIGYRWRWTWRYLNTSVPNNELQMSKESSSAYYSVICARLITPRWFAGQDKTTRSRFLETFKSNEANKLISKERFLYKFAIHKLHNVVSKSFKIKTLRSMNVSVW